MKKRGWMIGLVVACVVVVLAAVAILMPPGPASHPDAASEPATSSGEPSESEPEVAVAQGGDTDGGEASLQPPTQEDLREDLPENPHAPTAELIEFAERLAPKMEAAEASVEKAREFLVELESCVMEKHETGAKPVQALCLANAAELAELHPELKAQYEGIFGRAPPAVKKLLEAAETID